jgi:DNA-binding PadR family transcriptional regulator
MRKRAEWMNPATDPVLEILAESELALTAGVLNHNIDREFADPPSRSSVYRTVDSLREYGLIETSLDTDNYYVITDLGRRYLAGELDAGELASED